MGHKVERGRSIYQPKQAIIRGVERSPELGYSACNIVIRRRVSARIYNRIEIPLPGHLTLGNWFSFRSRSRCTECALIGGAIKCVEFQSASGRIQYVRRTVRVTSRHSFVVGEPRVIVGDANSIDRGRLRNFARPKIRRPFCQRLSC